MEITLRLPFQIMSQSVTIYHNPRCSKSRQTLALLEEHMAHCLLDAA